MNPHEKSPASHVRPVEEVPREMDADWLKEAC